MLFLEFKRKFFDLLGRDNFVRLLVLETKGKHLEGSADTRHRARSNESSFMFDLAMRLPAPVSSNYLMMILCSL